MSTDVERLAERFVAEIRRELTPEQLAGVDRRNHVPGALPGSCATHDFCDANMPMAAAFEAVMGREPDVSAEDDAALWSAAWDVAVKRGFSGSALPG